MVAIDGFTLIRNDRDCEKINKGLGGGVCLYVNDKWCAGGNITERKRVNTPDLDLLSVSVRPRYLPREFGQLFITVIYNPAGSSPSRAAKEISDVVRELEIISPDAPNFVIGDFNQCKLRARLPKFQQYVDVPTRKGKTLDQCYGNVPNAYKSFALPPIGLSDHDTVHLVPSYRPKIQTEPVVKKVVKCWSRDCIEELKGCFEATDWDLFIDSSETVSEAADVTSCYIQFCEDMIVPTKTIKVFPNNKPWISKSIKTVLNEKKVGFQSGVGLMERKVIQGRVRQELKKGLAEYKKKTEEKFKEGNMKEAWNGLKILSGQEKTRPTSIMSEEDQASFSEELNQFYCRFEREDLRGELDKVIEQVKEKVELDEEDFDIQRTDVERVFSKVNSSKAMGPDGIGRRVLKSCCSQLSYIFTLIFNWSLRDCIVPEVWKDSVICPVPKNNKPKSLNDYRPVALTSIVMKSFERIILSRLLKQTAPFQDTHQFAYKPNRSTDDATLTLLQHAYTHLEKTKSFVLH